MSASSKQSSEALRTRLEFPVWHGSFMKSYNAWTNAPSDLKAPLLLTGGALAKAEDWLLFCPEKLTDSQKRFIMRSIAQRAREPVHKAPTQAKKSRRVKVRRPSDQILMQLVGVCIIGLWFFAPDKIRDIMEVALTSQETQRKVKAALEHKPPQPPASAAADADGSGGRTDAKGDVPSTSDADARGETAREATTDDGSSSARLKPAAAPPPPPPPSAASRMATLAREQLAAGHMRTALLLGIEAATLAAADGDGAEARKAAADAAGVLFQAMARRDRLGELATRSATTATVRFCDDARGVVTITAGDVIAVWPAEGNRRTATIERRTTSLDGAGLDRECRLALLPNEDFNVEVRALANGRRSVQLIGHEATITAATFSPDGSAIATASQDSTARVWDARSGRQRALLSGHDWHVADVQFSPDGRRVLTAGSDNTARIWDAATGRQLSVVGPHNGVVTAARFDADGSHVLTTSWDGHARLWSSETGKLIQQFTVAGGIVGAQMSRDRRRISALAMDGGAYLWDSANSEPLRKLETSDQMLHSVTFSADGRWLASLTWQGSVELHDPASGARISALSSSTDRIRALSFAQGGNSIIAVTEAGDRLTWPLFASTADAVAQATAIAPACLSADERATLGIEGDAPAWCKTALPRDAALPR